MDDELVKRLGICEEGTEIPRLLAAVLLVLQIITYVCDKQGQLHIKLR